MSLSVSQTRLQRDLSDISEGSLRDDTFLPGIYKISYACTYYVDVEYIIR